MSMSKSTSTPRARNLLLLGGFLVLSLPLFNANCLSTSEEGDESISDRSSERTLSPDEEALSTIPNLSNKALCDKAAPGFMHCHARIRTQPDGTIMAAATPSGLVPADLQSAYAVPQAGDGVTVAIVDAQDNPNAESDLATYRKQFGLPPCTTANGCFKKVNQNGQASPLPTADSGWAGEIALDLDMVSAVCPKCKILLVEANTASMEDLGAAVNAAASLGAAAISNSYGGGEDSSITGADAQFFNHPGIAITVSSGDDGFGVEYPASSAHVLAVGGTSLVKSSGNARGWTEAAWSGAGSGCSKFIAKPGAQKDTGCAKRSVADVSAVADPNTGVAVFDTFGGAPAGATGWVVFGGTSAAAPIVAAVLAATGKANTDNSYPYSHAGAFFDVTSGNNGTCSSSAKYLCTATAGFDGPTGLGTPNGALLASGGGGTGGGGSSTSSTSSTTAATTSATSGGGSTCSHAICKTGAKLTSSCDPCATKVCAADSFCCSSSWDSVCVGEVGSICGVTCGGGGGGTGGAGGTSSTTSATSGGGSTCAHAICSNGSKLTSSCDPCATQICASDSFCCSTLWDSTCVGEVSSICKQTCN